MKKGMISFFVFFFCIQGFSSVYLYNDSPFILKAVVIGANGVNVGEKLLQPQELSYLADQIGSSDPVNRDKIDGFKNYKNSLTPYKVFWYCQEGTLYAACQNTAAGATVMASSCQGPCYCKAPKEEKKASEDAYKEE